MRKRSPKNSPGLVNCLPNSRKSDRLRDKATSSSTTSSKNEISKYFIKETVNNESKIKKQQPEFYSPYKNIISEPIAYLNSSMDDKKDFKSPVQFKSVLKVLQVDKKCKKTNGTITKQKKTKKKSVKGQVKLTKLIKDQCEYGDTNPEHIQMALALSKSEQPNEGADSDDFSLYPSTQEKKLTLRKMLEQFGFTSEYKEIDRKKEVPRRKKKSKYQFIKPILYLRNEEDRQNLISSKISMILSENSLPEYTYEKEKPIIRSKYLSTMFDNTSKLYNMDKISYEAMHIHQFYLKDLNIEMEDVKCGHQLKDWHKIPGRERSPPRNIQTLGLQDSGCNGSEKENTESAQQIVVIKDDAESITSNDIGNKSNLLTKNAVLKIEQQNSLDINIQIRSLSPDLFSSEDEEIKELKRSIDESLETSLKVINNIQTIELSQRIWSKEQTKDTEFEKNDISSDIEDEYKTTSIFEEKLKNNLEDIINIEKLIDKDELELKHQSISSLYDDMNKTDDVLATLEITLTENIHKITTPENKNFNAFSASLLSNVESLNKWSSQEMQSECSDDSICELTFTSMNGIEHFESFYNKRQETLKENIKDSDEICDLTLSEAEENSSNKIGYDKMFEEGKFNEDTNEASGEDPEVTESDDKLDVKSDNSVITINNFNESLVQVMSCDNVYDLTQSDQDFDEKIDKNSFNFYDNTLNLGSSNLMDYRGDINTDFCNRSRTDNTNDVTIDKLVDENEINKIKSKYEIFSDSDDNNDNFRNKIGVTDIDIKELLENSIKNIDDNLSSRFRSNSGDSNTNLRRFHSLTPSSNWNSPKFLKKHATFSTPSPQKDNFQKNSSASSSSSGNLDNDNIICISDEELNYSSLHSTPFKRAFDKTYRTSLLNNRSKEDYDKNNISVENEVNNDITSYSYLEKYYDDQFYTEYNHDLPDNHIEQIYSPIPHPRILELTNRKTPSKEIPRKETTISQNNDGLNSTSTPSKDGIIIKTRNITPMTDYDNMNTPKILEELKKFGVKQLKRHRGVQILKHIYETTHPMYSNEDGNCEEDSDDNINVKRPKLMGFKSRRKLEVDSNVPDYNYKQAHLQTNANSNQGVKIVGDILESGDLIFERKYSKKVPSCAVPLHIAWHNLVGNNMELKQNILLYEPLQLEIIYFMLKEQGYNYHTQDLLTFLDKKCITIRTGYNNKHSRKRF